MQPQKLNAEAIFNLKSAQAPSQRVVVLKNHERKVVNIYPDSRKSEYLPGDIIEFSLKGQGLDYINLGDSTLWVKAAATDPTHPDRTRLLHGLFDIFQRQEIKYGSNTISDNVACNKYLYLNYKGSVNYGGTLGAGWTSNMSLTKLGPDSYAGYPFEPERWHQVPFRTILDDAGYLPISNLAQNLTLRWTIAPPIEVIGPENYEENKEIPQNASYKILDIFLELVGEVVLSGGELNAEPIKYHTLDYISFQNQISSAQALTTVYPYQGGADFSFSYPIHRSSLKSMIGAFFDNAGIPIEGTDSEAGVPTLGSRKNPQNQGCYRIIPSIAGEYYPYRNGLREDAFIFREVQRYFRKVDNTLGNSEISLINFNNQNWSSVITEDNNIFTFRPFFFCVNFDKIDQNSQITSGINTINTNVDCTWEGLCFLNENNGDAAPRDLVVFFNYDIVVQIVEGEIIIHA